MWRFLLVITVCVISCLADPPRAVHFPLTRRGGAFASQWTANLTFLVEQLRITESRFNLTKREVKGNKVIRVPKEEYTDGGITPKLMGEPGKDGIWNARTYLGDPAQFMDFDLDMLTTDTVLTTTSSQIGATYDVYFSQTYKPSFEIPFPGCTAPNESLFIPTVKKLQPITLTHCRPHLQSLNTLKPSGAVLGMAPSSSLSQIERARTLFRQLVDVGIVENELFSLTLLSGDEGLLSIGGSVAEIMAKVEDDIANFLGGGIRPAQPEHVPQSEEEDAVDAANGASQDFLGAAKGVSQANLNIPSEIELAKRQAPEPGKAPINPFMGKPARHRGTRPQLPIAENWRDQWKWSPIQGAAGWWQTLLRGIWLDNIKILKNQPIIVDINTPFILAPPVAVRQFYAAIPGSFRLPPPYTNFYAYPCLNPPEFDLEFGGWRFPVMRGAKSSYEQRGPNGKFSLGKIDPESGYCVGAVVETRMGVADHTTIKKSSKGRSDPQGGFGNLEPGMLAGNGLRDVWILGEPAFRGMGIIFDLKSKEIGFRDY